MRRAAGEGGKIWVIIVNFRTADMVIDCLRSLSEQVFSFEQFRVVIVDNASADGSSEKLQAEIERQGWKDWASVRSSDINGGFAFGNNIGIREALAEPRRCDYVMLLNPDTIVYPGAIRALADFLDSHPRAGIAGGGFESGEGALECSAHNAPSPLGEFLAGAQLDFLNNIFHGYVPASALRAEAHQCDWVGAASFMVRPALFEQIGLFDEDYFLYFEEVDFCARARKAGWEIWFVPRSRVVHLGGAATGIRDAARRRPAYWFESRRRYFIKHSGATGLLLADALWAAGRASLAVRRFLRLGSGGKVPEPKGFAFDLLAGDLRAVFGWFAAANRDDLNG